MSYTHRPVPGAQGSPSPVLIEYAEAAQSGPAALAKLPPLGPSRLASLACGYTNPTPDLLTYPHRLRANSYCCMCRTPLFEGNWVQSHQKSFDAAFNLKTELMDNTPWVCVHCIIVWSADFTSDPLASALYCADGVFGLKRNTDIAAMLKNPPKGPFLATFLTTKQAHLVWRAPVCWDASEIQVRFGSEVLSVPVKPTFEALAAWRVLVQMGRDAGLKPAPAVTDAKMKASRLGEIHPSYIQLAREAGREDCITAISGLSSGQWWALNALRQSDDDAPAEMFCLRTPQGQTFERPTLAQLAAEEEANAANASQDQEEG